MSNVAKIALPLLLVAAAAGGAIYVLNQDDHTPIDVPGPVDPGPGPQPSNPVITPETGSTAPPPIERVADRGERRATSNAKQGISGTLLLPTGHPAAGIEVVLVKSAASNPLEVFLQNQSGDIPAPLATGRTAEDGSFMLGLHSTKNGVDFRSLSADFPTLNRSNLKVRKNEWLDVGQLRLKQGLVINGRVIDSRSKHGVGGAMVYLKSNASTGAMVAVPGHEKGTMVVADDNGVFQFVNGPRGGTVNIVAEAEGFASTSLLSKQLSAESANNFTIELERGHTIMGVCVDQNGNRIPGAELTATGLSAKTPQIETTRSNEDGEFEFPPLHEGPYSLMAKSGRYADTTMPMALTGDDVKIVMATRGVVKLKVMSAKNRPIKAYRISLKRSFPNNPQSIGNVFGHKDRNISPRDYPQEFNGEWARIEGLPAGTFRFQITDREHAKTLSPIFEVVVGQEPVEVVANMTLGATITGTVIDDRGQPVKGAVVASDMNAGMAANIGILDVFRTMMPEKHSSKQVRTDAQGRFRMSKLAFADYMLRISHPKYCEGVAIDITLQQEGQTVDAGVIQLQLGAQVKGVCTVGGVPTGQIEVRVSMPLNKLAQNAKKPEPGKPAQLPKGQVLFNAKVLSGNDGSYQLLKRVPPGTYEVTAARRTGGSPFDALMDIKNSKQELVVHPGQDEILINFDLPAR